MILNYFTCVLYFYFKFRAEDTEKGFRFILERRFFEWNRSPFSKNFCEASTAEEMVKIFENVHGEQDTCTDKSDTSTSDKEVDSETSCNDSTSDDSESSSSHSSDAAPSRKKV